MNRDPSRLQWSLAAALAALSVGCVGTDLEAPANHPGHPRARSGPVQTSAALREDFDPSRSPVAARAEPPRSGDHAAHEHHGEHGAAGSEPAPPAEQDDGRGAHEH